jgi:hypothetical protein
MDKYFTKKELVQMVKAFNKRGGTRIRTGGSRTKTELYSDLKSKMNGSINVNKCAMNGLDDIKNDPIFKVRGPTGSGEWLSTIDINSIMNQYQELHSEFMYLGTVPIDFKKIYPEIFNVSLKKDSHTKYGMIVNTDPSTKSGKHWIALFIDESDNTICFFDSNGSDPPKQVLAFIKKINKNNPKKFQVFINAETHQREDGTCGLYALNFIVSRIKGQQCSNYFKCIKSDTIIEKSRKIMYK